MVLGKIEAVLKRFLLLLYNYFIITYGLFFDSKNILKITKNLFNFLFTLHTQYKVYRLLIVGIFIGILSVSVVNVHEVYASSISINVTDSVTATAVPKDYSGTIAVSDTNTANISVKTDNFTGYTLSLYSDKTSPPPLVNGSSSISSITSQIESLNNFTLGTWGYKPTKKTDGGWENLTVKHGDSTYETGYYLPGPTTTPDIIDITKRANTTENQYNIAVAAKIDLTTTPGAYTESFVVAAVANEVPLYLQDIESWMDVEIPNVGNSVQAVDIRDDKIYRVIRLADGNVWMKDNLRLGDSINTITLTPEDSNVSSNFILPASSDSWSTSSTSSQIYYDTNNSATGRDEVFYNWYTAVAGTINADTAAEGTIATSSICPKGWELPTGSESGDFRTLKDTYNDWSKLKVDWGFVLAGEFNAGQKIVEDQSNAGYLWSSTVASPMGGVGRAFDFYGYADKVQDSNADRGSYWGFSVRCISRDRTPTYTITLNNQSATTPGTSSIYETYGKKYSLKSNGLAMTSSANPITKPARVYNYNISYNANGTGITMPTSPSSATRTDTFKGYYTASSGGTQYINANGYLTTNASTTQFSANGTLYAQWTNGSASIMLPALSKPGNSCKWAVGSASGTQYAPGTSITVSGNTTLYAVCVAATNTISFNQNSGNLLPRPSGQETYTQGHNMTITYYPTTQSYNMVISTDDDPYTTIGSSVYLEAGKTYSMHATLKDTSTGTVDSSGRIQVFYAANISSYTESQSLTLSGEDIKNFTVPSTGTYTIRLDNDYHKNMTLDNFWIDQSTIQTANVVATYGSAMPSISSTIPTRTGYKFMGWYDNADYTQGTQYYTNSNTSARSWDKESDLTLYAGWAASSYTMTYNDNGGSGGPGVVTYDSQTITLSSTTPTRSSYTFKGWSADSSATSATYQAGGSYTFATGAYTATLYAVWESSGCVTAGTMVALADGTQVKVEDLVESDPELLAWNFEDGSYVSRPMVFIEPEKEAEYHVIHTIFSDGTDIGNVSEHGYFDVDLGKFIYINEDNPEQYVGHHFVKNIGDEKWDTVELVEIKHTTEKTTIYGLNTFETINFYVNNMLSIEGNITGMFNYFDVNTDTMSYDSVKKAADIAEYGLLSREEFGDMISDYAYEAFNGKYLGVAIGKGVATWEGIGLLAERYMPITNKSADSRKSSAEEVFDIEIYCNFLIKAKKRQSTEF